MGKYSLSNIAEELSVRSGITREAATQFLHAFIETIEKGLLQDNIVKVKGLGTFKVQEMNDRDSVDVNTGSRITIKGYRKVTFVPDSAMKELVNRPFAHFEPTELHDGYPAEDDSVAIDDVLGTDEDVENADEGVAANVVTNVEIDTNTNTNADTHEASELTVATDADAIAEKIAVEESAAEEVLQESVVMPVEVEVHEIPEQTPEIIPEETLEAIPEGQESAIEPIQEAANDQSPSSLASEPKQRRGCGCVWGVLFVAIALFLLLGGYRWLAYGTCAKEQQHEEPHEELEDIVVKPNLEAELGTVWDEMTKSKKSASSATKPAKPAKAAKQSAPATQDTSQVTEVKPIVADTSHTSAAAQHPTASDDIAPQPAGKVGHDVLPLTASLKAKAVKDITLADTTDYIIEGTLVAHRLKRGETIIQLAYRYYGDKRLWPYLVKHNNIKDYNTVAIGQEIRIPVLKQKSAE